MRKPLIVCGSRSMTYGIGNLGTVKDAVETIREVCRSGGYDQIVSGGADGADSIGEMVAREDGLGLVLFPADWDKHGRAAGPKRNEQMARYAASREGGIVAFKGGKGTADMLKRARWYGVKIEYNANEATP